MFSKPKIRLKEGNEEVAPELIRESKSRDGRSIK
jgi:hypothetical protein